jgi:hypothetical protein
MQSCPADLCRSGFGYLHLSPTFIPAGFLFTIARIASLFAVVESIGYSMMPSKWPRPIFYILNPGSRPGAVSLGIKRAALLVALRALRILVPTAGVFLPEVVFGVFHLHKHLLKLGLYLRTQCIELESSANSVELFEHRGVGFRLCFLDHGLGQAIPLDEERIRQLIFERVLARLKEDHRLINHRVFKRFVFEPVSREVLSEEILRVRPELGDGQFSAGPSVQ